MTRCRAEAAGRGGKLLNRGQPGRLRRGRAWWGVEGLSSRRAGKTASTEHAGGHAGVRGLGPSSSSSGVVKQSGAFGGQAGRQAFPAQGQVHAVCGVCGAAGVHVPYHAMQCLVCVCNPLHARTSRVVPASSLRAATLLPSGTGTAESARSPRRSAQSNAAHAHRRMGGTSCGPGA